MPLICHNTDWWVLDFMDGFGVHLISEETNTICFKNKILSLKDKGDSLSINQAYDKYVFKEDKPIQCNNFTFIRESRKWNSNINGRWCLLHCGLSAVRHTTMHPQLWVNSLIAVNLKPTERIKFEE